MSNTAASISLGRMFHRHAFRVAKFAAGTMVFLFCLPVHGESVHPITLNLTGVAAWQCREQRDEGRAFANETVAFVGPDCPRFFAEQGAIFATLSSTAKFEPGNFSELCFLEGYRAELQTISQRMRDSCRDQLSANMRAGMTLGNIACRLAPEGALTPEFHIGKIEAVLSDVNGHPYVMELFLPLRSERWANQMSRSQEAGFMAGCILGERDFVAGISNPYLDDSGKPDWRRAGNIVGEHFGDAYCPIEAKHVDVIVASLAGSSGHVDAATKLSDARGGFIEGFSRKCAAPITDIVGQSL